MSEIKIVIPARYASTRLPAKPLRLLAGKPLVQHVYECALRANLGEIVIATDDQRIADVCHTFSATVCMTADTHQSGSDRLAEVVNLNQWNDDTIIINLQGDEPLTPAICLEQVAANLQRHPQAAIATLATAIQSEEEYLNPNVVKVITDKQHFALYFSRSPLPYQRDGHLPYVDFAWRHIGIYAYRAHFLKKFSSLESSPLEQLEKLEQLRAMWHGEKIHVDLAKALPGHGVDTDADLQRVELLLSNKDYL